MKRPPIRSQEERRETEAAVTGSSRLNHQISGNHRRCKHSLGFWRGGGFGTVRWESTQRPGTQLREPFHQHNCPARVISSALHTPRPVPAGETEASRVGPLRALADPGPASLLLTRAAPAPTATLQHLLLLSGVQKPKCRCLRRALHRFYRFR